MAVLGARDASVVYAEAAPRQGSAHMFNVTPRTVITSVLRTLGKGPRAVQARKSLEFDTAIVTAGRDPVALAYLVDVARPEATAALDGLVEENWVP